MSKDTDLTRLAAAVTKVPISPSPPPSPKLQRIELLARIGDHFANAAKNARFSDAARAAFTRQSLNYFKWALEEQQNPTG